jgi:hypothetical protein
MLITRGLDLLSTICLVSSNCENQTQFNRITRIKELEHPRDATRTDIGEGSDSRLIN